MPLASFQYKVCLSVLQAGPCFPFLHKLTNLTSLDLSLTSLSDAGLEAMKNLRNMQILSLSSTDVTSAGKLSPLFYPFFCANHGLQDAYNLTSSCVIASYLLH